MFEPYYTSYINHIEFGGATAKTAPILNNNGKWEYDWDTFEK